MIISLPALKIRTMFIKVELLYNKILRYDFRKTISILQVNVCIKSEVV